MRYVDRASIRVERVVLSTQYAEDIDTPTLREEVRRHIVEAVIPDSLRAGRFEVFTNPTSRFTVGGPKADTGLTGRKIIAELYGGACPHEHAPWYGHHHATGNRRRLAGSDAPWLETPAS